MQCREVEQAANLSLDGEVSPAEQAELESHLMRCPNCRDRATGQRWLHDNVRAKLQSSSDDLVCPSNLKGRISTELRYEHQSRRGLSWRAALPLTLAAAVVGILAWSQSTAPGLDPDASVDNHTRNTMPELRAHPGTRDVQRYVDNRLGQRVSLPRVKASDFRLVGVRMSNMDRRETAHLMYDHHGARVSVFAHPRTGQLAAPAAFRRQLVRGQPVLVGRHRGYTLAATERDGVVYRFVSDLDSPALLQFVSSLHGDNPPSGL